MNKTEFFDLMTANRNYINRDSVVAINSRNDVYVKSVGIANTGISSHKTEAAALVACEKYSRWFAEWLHVEALEMNDAYNTLYVYAPGDAVREVWEHLTAVERVVSVECAHKQALAEDYRFDWLANRFGIFWAGTDFFARRSMIEDARDEALEINATIDVINADKAEGDKVVMGINADIALNIAHAEALEINAAIDLMIDERDHVSNCSYEGFDEQDRLNRIGRGCVNELDKRLGESFVKVRALALRLWANGFVTYPPEDCGAEYAQCCIECRQQWVWGAA